VAYTHTTFQNLVDQLAADLNDSSKVFFTDFELRRNIREALRIWNILTGWNRYVGSFNTTSGVAFYHLPTQFPDHLGSTVTAHEIIGDMQLRLMEPYEPIASTGISEMFTHADLVRALQQKRNRYYAETNSNIIQQMPIFVNAGDGIVELPDNVISITRAVWRTSDNKYYRLTSTDEATSTSFLPSWRQTANIPRHYSVAAQPQLTVQLIPPPSASGELLLFCNKTGDNIDTTVSQVLGPHDDIAWGIGWGALETLLLRDGIGRDPERAQMCGQMYSLSIELAKSLPMVLGVSINDVMIPPTALKMLDTMKAGWEGGNTGAPMFPALMEDWLAIYPVPDDIYNVSVSMVRRSPTPLPADSIELGREQLAAVVGWARQLCAFKQEGSQLQQGIQASTALVEQARIYNEDRLRKSQYLCETYGISTESVWKPPREAVTEIGSDDPRDVSNSRQSRNRDTEYRRPTRRLGGK
jgi:hypothetical protein